MTANRCSARSRGRRVTTSAMSLAVAVARQPQAAATAARSVPRPVWLACDTGFAERRVVEHGDRQVGRARTRRWWPASPAHQHVAVPGQHQDAPARLRQRQAQADHRGAAHGAPEVEIQRPVARRGSIIGGGAEAGDHQQVARVVAVTSRPRRGGRGSGRCARVRKPSVHENLGADQALREQHRDRARNSRTPVPRRRRRSRRLPRHGRHAGHAPRRR